jgi:hypothetical protein
MYEESITEDAYNEYVSLSDELKEIAFEFGETDAIGVEIFHPLNGGSCSESDWAEVIVKEKANLPPNAEWDEWKTFNARKGCSRLFGCGDKSSRLKEFLALVERARDLLYKYSEFDVPDSLKWKAPVVIVMFGEPYFFWDDEPLAFLNVVHRTDLSSSVFYHGPSVRQIIVGKTNFEVSQYEDICSTSADALESWLPEECIFRPKMDNRTFTALSNRYKESHIFKKIDEHWLLRYPEDKDGIFNDRVGIQYIAKVLSKKYQEMDVFEIEGIDDERIKMSFSNERAVGKEEIEFVLAQMEDLKQRIDYEESHDGNEVKIAKMSLELERCELFFKKDISPKGVRLLDKKQGYEQARKRVGICMDRTIKIIEKKMPLLAKHLDTSIIKQYRKLWYRPLEDLNWLL